MAAELPNPGFSEGDCLQFAGPSRLDAGTDPCSQTCITATPKALAREFILVVPRGPEIGQQRQHLRSLQAGSRTAAHLDRSDQSLVRCQFEPAVVGRPGAGNPRFRSDQDEPVHCDPQPLCSALHRADCGSNVQFRAGVQRSFGQYNFTSPNAGAASFPAGPQHHAVPVHRRLLVDARESHVQVRREFPPLRRQRPQLLLYKSRSFIGAMEPRPCSSLLRAKPISIAKRSFPATISDRLLGTWWLWRRTSGKPRTT